MLLHENNIAGHHLIDIFLKMSIYKKNKPYFKVHLLKSDFEAIQVKEHLFITIEKNR
jgi:hypothetical protein